MKLIIYVHDFSRQIGHSRAMIEVIDQLGPESVKVVCYSHSPVNEINLDKQINYSFVKVPFSWLKPFLLRNLFFQIYTSLFYRSWTDPKEKSISIGVCTFIAQIINVQFSHFQWEKLYFSANPVTWYKTMYVKLLLKYLTISEDFCYRKEGLKFVFLSKFIQDAFVKRYQLNERNFVTAYSSANANQFTPSNQTREEKLHELKELYPELEKVDNTKPTLLFVGAFERKGLPLFAEKVPSNCNFIIVGQPEQGSTFRIPQKQNIFHISFSKHISKLYDYCDLFVFPTIYEPFGLVLLEAALSGMKILTSKSLVGASELLQDLHDIEFCDPFAINQSDLIIDKPLSESERLKNAEVRKKALESFTWEECAKAWKKIL